MLHLLVSRYKDPVKLIKIGTDFRKEQKRIIKKLKLANNIIFLGYVSQGELITFYNLADLLLYPSLHEGFGFPVLEAMACEVPVIGSGSGEIPNVIGDAGLVFKEGDAEDLRNKLHSLIVNQGYKKELAKKGRRRVLKKYVWERIARETFRVYQDLMSCS